jgi:hypothetical protein
VTNPRSKRVVYLLHCSVLFVTLFTLLLSWYGRNLEGSTKLTQKCGGSHTASEQIIGIAGAHSENMTPNNKQSVFSLLHFSWNQRNLYQHTRCSGAHQQATTAAGSFSFRPAGVRHHPACRRRSATWLLASPPVIPGTPSLRSTRSRNQSATWPVASKSAWNMGLDRYLVLVLPPLVIIPFTGVEMPDPAGRLRCIAQRCA